jgi:hypothetical protein
MQFIAAVTVLLSYLRTNVPGVDFDKRRIVISIRGTLSMKVSQGCYKYIAVISLIFYICLGHNH